jgi:hypothetical protein
MKTILTLSTLVAALSVSSMASFAQNFVTYPSAPYGNAHPTIRTVAPVFGRFTVSDFASQGSRRPERLHSPGR